jgi:dihydrofolate synthase/folylpolyglutamate synthase
MRYATAIAKLFALQARGMRPGIERMRAALEFRGIDPDRLPFLVIQVAGTNGKGSVSAMLELGLRRAGRRTGLFTSPHLHRFSERVRIDGQPLSTRETSRKIAELLRFSRSRGAPELSFFELTTLLAIEAFREHACDVVVLEVGLGGRLDSTTALGADLSVITRIALDHTQLLGGTLAKIAREKAGIIRRGVPVIVGVRSPAALRVILAQAQRMAAPVRLIDRDFSVRVVRSNARRGQTDSAPPVTITLPGRSLTALRLGLAGEHQRDNAALAAAALHELELPSRALRAALQDTRWPARLETLPGQPAVLLDAAHNPDGCAALATYLATRAERPRVLVFGVMADKDHALMLKLLAAEVETFVFCQPRLPRATPATELARARPGLIASSPAQGLRLARRAAGSGGLVIVAGSIFLVAELRARILRIASDPLIRL